MADLKIVYCDPADIIPYAMNSRTHSDDQVAQVAASIKEFGFTNPILVDEFNVIIAGHGRLLAAKKLGLLQVPTIQLEGLTEAQRKAYVIADNKLALNAGWDDQALQAELERLQELDFDLELTGFDPDELAKLLEPEQVEGLTDEDTVPDVPEEPVSREGDIWVCGNHRVMCGDSTSIDALDRLLDGMKPNAVVTDPPYGIGIDGQKKSVSQNPKHNRKHHEFKGWDNERPDEGIFNYVIGLQCPAVIWGGNYFADLLPATRGWIYWSKGQDGLTMSDGELAWTTEDKPLRSTTVNRAALRGSVHPTQKPIDVITYSMDYIKVPVNGSVLDLFGGSGTTMIASEKTDRNAFIMEKDQSYVDVIVKRWQDFTGKKAVLESTGQTFDEVSSGEER